MIQPPSKGNLRGEVAREAARLLYLRLEKEYVNAKRKAAATLGATFLPSNLEVAEELDRIAEEVEGEERRDRLLRLRERALTIMEAVRDFNSKLVGSVWRGTARKGSDIDVYVYSHRPSEVLKRLRDSGFEVWATEWRSKAQGGKARSYLHIYLAPRVEGAEIVVKDPSEADEPEKCAVYGDPILGLTADELRRLLRDDPLRRHTPKEK